MIISVASGKGGTGKTTIATNLALSLGEAQLIDCDVEEPNANIFLNAELNDTEIVGVSVPVIDRTKCTFCGTCSDFCRFNALAVVKSNVLVFPELCHGCGGCTCSVHIIGIVHALCRYYYIGFLLLLWWCSMCASDVTPPIVRIVTVSVLRYR